MGEEYSIARQIAPSIVKAKEKALRALEEYKTTLEVLCQLIMDSDMPAMEIKEPMIEELQRVINIILPTQDDIEKPLRQAIEYLQGHKLPPKDQLPQE